MRKSEALRLKPGAIVQLKSNGVGRVLTVTGVIPAATREEPAGTFPLIQTKEERGAITYRLLDRITARKP